MSALDEARAGLGIFVRELRDGDYPMRAEPLATNIERVLAVASGTITDEMIEAAAIAIGRVDTGYEDWDHTPEVERVMLRGMARAALDAAEAAR